MGMSRRAYCFSSESVTRLRFLSNCEKMFVKGLAFELEGTYSAFMCSQLSSSPTILFLGKRALKIGGPGSITHDMKIRCLARMANWTKLAKMVIQAEFPSYSLFYSLGVVTQLSSGDAGVTQIVRGERDLPEQLRQACELLAKEFALEPAPQLPDHVLFDIDVCLCAIKESLGPSLSNTTTFQDTLFGQILACRQKAQMIHSKQKLSYSKAWVQAVRQDKQLGHDVSALETILLRVVGYGFSTAGVERTSQI
jgi:hypothetical protein